MLNSSSNTFQAVYHEIIIIFLYFGKFGYKQKEKRKLVITMEIILSCKSIKGYIYPLPRGSSVDSVQNKNIRRHILWWEISLIHRLFQIWERGIDGILFVFNAKDKYFFDLTGIYLCPVNGN